MRRVSTVLLLSVFFSSLLLVSVNIREVRASWTIYIRADGSIDPSDAPIQRDGENYTFTDDINGTIIVERDFITVDGNGYLLRGTGNENGILVFGRVGVTIQNTRFMSFGCGVWYNSSSHNTASANDFANCTSSFWFSSCSNNTLNGNNMTGNVYGQHDGWYAIGVISSNNNTISGNYIDGCNYNILLDNSSDNTIHGNNVANGYTGVYLYIDSNENTITDNTLTGNLYGIKSEDFNYDNLIRNNTIRQSLMYGIALWGYSDNNVVCDNSITANDRTGIRLNRSSNTTITGNSLNASGISCLVSRHNNISGNKFSGSNINLDSSSINTINANTFNDGGLKITGSFRNVVENNTVNSKPLLYLEKESNLVVDYEVGQVVLVNCSGMLVENLQLADTNIGVILCRTNNTKVRNNTITGSDGGIEMNSRARNNSIHGNTLTANSGYGLRLISSSDTRIFDNTITDNAGGISLASSSNISIIGNNVTANQERGIYLDNSLDNHINENIIIGNSNGIALYESSNNTIRGNCIAASRSSGIFLNGWESPSANNTITENKIAGNMNGIKEVCDPSTNTFYHNDILDNTYQVLIWALGTWDNGYPSGGNYWSDYTGTDIYSGAFQNETGSDGIGDTRAHSVDRYPLMVPYPWTSHDIGIVDLKPQRDVVEQSQTMSVNVTLLNYGNYTEAFNVTVYANAIQIDTSDMVVLASRDYATFTFTWNTTGLSVGNYTLTAEVSTVPDDADMLDNTLADWVLITIPGDVDGDRDVDIFDIILMADAYGVESPDSRYDPRCDLDSDGDIDVFDIVIAIGHYGESW